MPSQRASTDLGDAMLIAMGVDLGSEESASRVGAPHAGSAPRDWMSRTCSLCEISEVFYSAARLLAHLRRTHAPDRLTINILRQHGLSHAKRCQDCGLWYVGLTQHQVSCKAALDRRAAQRAADERGAAVSACEDAEAGGEYWRPPKASVACTTPYSWGKRSKEEFEGGIVDAYEVTTNFRRNIAKLPGGKHGKWFLLEKARLYRQAANGGPLEAISQKAIATMEHLLLQKPRKDSRAKDHIKCLGRRRKLWEEGDIAGLLEEAAIRKRLPARKVRKDSVEDRAERFASLIFEGRDRDAMRMLDEGESKGVLELTPETKQVLADVHFDDQPVDESALLKGPVHLVHEAVFEEITGDAIKKAVLKSKGGAGPSGGDARHWQDQLTALGDASRELCEAMAAWTRRLCSSAVSRNVLEAFLANRGVALDKNPGTRPLGIGEMPRRICAKAVLVITRPDIKEASANANLCGGQEAAVQAIFHAVTELFEGDECDAVLLADANQGYQRLNRKVALHNLNIICPILYIVAVNFYGGSSRVFISPDFEVMSREGVTMGCPLAMMVYGLSLTPLIAFLGHSCRFSERPDQRRVDEGFDGEISSLSVCVSSESMSMDDSTEYGSDLPPGGATPERMLAELGPSPDSPSSVSGIPRQSPPPWPCRQFPLSMEANHAASSERRPPVSRLLTQLWYVDDGQAAGALQALAVWWARLSVEGPKYGYFATGKKNRLVTKPGLRAQAERLFRGTGVQIVDGAKDLGAAIGSEDFVLRYWQDKIADWRRRVELLAVFAESQPHAALWGFHQLKGEWTFAMGMDKVLHSKMLFQPLEAAISSKLLPALLGSEVSEDIRELLGLPCRLAGLGIDNPSELASGRYADMAKICAELKGRLLSGSPVPVNSGTLTELKAELRKVRRERQGTRLDVLKARASRKKARAITLALEKGASTIFTTPPRAKYRFSFRSKRDFRDLVRMRYGMRLRDLPEKCACGNSNSLDHSQSCRLGGFIIARHHDICNVWAGLCKRAGHRDVGREPMLQPLSGEVLHGKSANRADNARSDVRVNGFFGKHRDAFFDVKVINALAISNFNTEPKKLYEEHARQKRREYGQRIAQVEDGDFVPLIMLSTGSMGPEMVIAFQKLCKEIAFREKGKYAEVATLARAQLSFALARASLVCLRGSRTINVQAQEPLGNVDLAMTELDVRDEWAWS